MEWIKKVIGFSENLLKMGKHVESLEKSTDYIILFCTVQDPLLGIKNRQADVDQKMMGIVAGSSKINDMIKRCVQYSGISERIMNIENRRAQHNTTRCTYQCSKITEKNQWQWFA